MDENLWDVAEVCTYLGCRARTTKGRDHAVAGFRRRGLPCLRIGGRLKFVPGEVRKWAASQKAS